MKPSNNFLITILIKNKVLFPLMYAIYFVIVAIFEQQLIMLFSIYHEGV